MPLLLRAHALSVSQPYLLQATLIEPIAPLSSLGLLFLLFSLAIHLWQRRRQNRKREKEERATVQSIWFKWLIQVAGRSALPLIRHVSSGSNSHNITCFGEDPINYYQPFKDRIHIRFNEQWFSDRRTGEWNLKCELNQTTEIEEDLILQQIWWETEIAERLRSESFHGSLSCKPNLFLLF